MYIMQDSPTTVKVFANSNTDAVNWTAISGGKPLFQLSSADWQTLTDWLGAVVTTPGTLSVPMVDINGKKPDDLAYILTYDTATPPNKVVDINGKHPADAGYTPTYSHATPSTTALVGNTAKLVTGGTVQLLNPDNTLHTTLTAVSIITNA